jgi:hypothetical protein
LASVALVGLTTANTRASARATTEQIDRFQLEVLAAINCEELALQPGLSDELARNWMLCSLYSLYDAISLAGDLGLTRAKLALTESDLGSAKTEDFSALKKHPLDREKIRLAMLFKRAVVKIIHKGVRQPPQLAGCNSQAGVAPQLRFFFEYEVWCQEDLVRFVFELRGNTITGKAGYVTPKGEHLCPHDRHEVDCKGIPRGTKIVNFFAVTTPPPQPGDIGLIGVILRGNKVGVFHRLARALSEPLQPLPTSPPPPPEPPPLKCNGSISLLSAGPPPVSGYNFSCDKDTSDFSITLAPDRSLLNASTPPGYTCAPMSANGGTNNVLHCDRTSGTTPAGQSVSGQILTNQQLATGSVKLTVSPQNANFSFTGP